MCDFFKGIVENRSAPSTGKGTGRPAGPAPQSGRPDSHGRPRADAPWGTLPTPARHPFSQQSQTLSLPEMLLNERHRKNELKNIIFNACRPFMCNMLITAYPHRKRKKRKT